MKKGWLLLGLSFLMVGCGLVKEDPEVASIKSEIATTHDIDKLDGTIIFKGTDAVTLATELKPLFGDINLKEWELTTQFNDGGTVRLFVTERVVNKEALEKIKKDKHLFSYEVEGTGNEFKVAVVLTEEPQPNS